MLTALTRAPAPTLVNCELTHLERKPIDFERASEQHRRYCAALAACGAQVVTLTSDADHPDSVFVEDTAIIFDEIAVLATPGAESRRAEVERIEPEIARLRPTAQIIPPATLEGGDVLHISKTVYVGLSSRTNAAGVEALRRIVAPYGYEVVAVPVADCLHLKTACTALDGGAILANPEWVDLSFFDGYKVMTVAPGEAWAANVLQVGPTLLMSADCPKTMQLVERRGYRVRPVDISEFAKAEAGLTCMSLVFKSPPQINA